MKTLRIGTRGSALALWQSRHVAGLLAPNLPGMQIELVEISSLGDRVTDVPLSHVEGTGFFTASIEQALIRRDVDVAVHSYMICRSNRHPAWSWPPCRSVALLRTCCAHAMARR